jgi:hypothetical protein
LSSSNMNEGDIKKATISAAYVLWKPCIFVQIHPLVL